LGYNANSEYYDEELATALKNDIGQFSAFKETSFRTQLHAALTENGEVVPWSAFKKKATELNVEYNQRWLKTEYHHTVATANSVDNWKRFEADADLYPNLRYNAVNDARTREQHRALDGLILPINHDFWKKHNVPLDWGCRCNLEQTDEEPSKTVPEILVKGVFKDNAALSGKVFGEMPYESGLSVEQAKEAKSFAKRSLENKSYEKAVLKEYKNGGKIISSNLVNKDSPDYNDVYKCCDHFAKKGRITEILPTVNIKSPLYKEIYGDLIGTVFEGKCPDFKVGNHFYELEGFTGTANADKLGKMLSRGIKQSSKLVLKDDGSTINHLKKLVNFAKSQGKTIDEVWLFKENGVLEQVY
jgi:SPP1 gp7 family putative phage head morphogenesis protein